MKILVTGGTGFIGSRLVPFLIEKGHEVGILGRSVRDGGRGELKSYRVDITRPIGPIAESYEAIVHLAGANDVDSREVETALVNTALGTKHVLDLAVVMGARRFVYFSTFQVYGLESGNVSEATPPAPNNDYGLTHLFAEQYVDMYQRLKGLESVCVRPTNIFGCPSDPEHDRWSLVPACFCKDAVNSGCIELLSSGKQHRDFISLDTVAECTEALCAASSLPTVMNLVSGQSRSILSVAEAVKVKYEGLFSRSCRLEVRGQAPERGEPLRVKTDVADLFIESQEDVDSAMAREIEATLFMLAARGGT